MDAAAMSLDLVQAFVAMALLGATLALLPYALRGAYDDLAPSRGALRLVAASVLCGALARAIAPHRLATIFMGYGWTESAIELYPIPRYGAGSLALHHTLFAVLPHDHRSLMAAHAVIGVLTIPIAAGFFARLFGAPARGALVAPWLALTPLLVRNDTSESNHVPALLFLFIGLATLARAPTSARARWLALPPLALAAIARPELAALVLVLVGVVLLAARAPARPALPLLVFAALITPHLLHVARIVASPEAREGLPGLQLARLAELDRAFWRWNVPADASLFPPGALVLAGLGALLAPRRLRGTMVLVGIAAVLAIVLYVPDLDRANMARVEVPAATLVLGLAGAGAAVLFAHARTKRGTIAIVIAILLAVASAIPSALVLFAPTNEDAEEEAIRRALAALPDTPLVLVRERSVDREERMTHAQFPDYLAPPHVTLVSFRELSPARFDRPVFAYLGVRCFARFRPIDAPRPRGPNLQPHCRALREHFRVRPVDVRRVPNRGDVWLDLYGEARALEIGLYRVDPPAR